MSVLPVGFGGAGGGGGGPGAYTIANSLRFRNEAAPKLQRTCVTATDARKLTLSLWVKRALLSTSQILASGYVSPTANEESLVLGDVVRWNSPGSTYLAQSTQILRDPSAHYHIVLRMDSTEATGADRVRIYVNNNLVATASAPPPLNYASFFSDAGAQMALGAYVTIGGSNLGGYLSEVHMVDGQSLDPTAFGTVDAGTGVWVAKNYSGSHGANGFKLTFADGSNLTNLCADSSGNGNNFTASNVSLTAGRTYDWMTDTPTNNFPVLNPLALAFHTLSHGNMAATLASAVNPRFLKTTMFQPSGKFYFEYVRVSGSSIGSFGVADVQAGTDSGGVPTNLSALIFGNGAVYVNNSLVTTTTSWTIGDVMSMAVDIDASTVQIRKNNTLIYTVTTLTSAAYSPGGFANNVGDVFDINCGQRPFTYTPPTGYAAMCTANIPPITPITSGTFVGNGNTNGPFVFLGGEPLTMTINGNAVTWGTHADKLANGFKLRTSSSSYNVGGSNTFSVSVMGDAFSEPNRATLNA